MQRNACLVQWLFSLPARVPAHALHAPLPTLRASRPARRRERLWLGARKGSDRRTYCCGRHGASLRELVGVTRLSVKWESRLCKRCGGIWQDMGEDSQHLRSNIVELHHTRNIQHLHVRSKHHVNDPNFISISFSVCKVPSPSKKVYRPINTFPQYCNPLPYPYHCS